MKSNSLFRNGSKKILLLVLVICITGSNIVFAQISNKKLLVDASVQYKISDEESSNLSIDEMKFPNRTGLKMLNKDHFRFEGKRKVPIDDSIHWYALEREYDNLYWENVDCKKIIVEFKRGISIGDKKVSNFLSSMGLKEISGKSLYPDIQNYFVFKIPNGNKEIVLSIIRSAREMEFILYAEPGLLIKAKTCPPNDPRWSQQWGAYSMYADSVWCYANAPSKNLIAIIDNAVSYNHSDLLGRVWYGFDYAMNDNNPSPDYAAQDHGTHVTGIVGANRNNGIGIAGMSRDTIFFAKVMNNNPSNEYLDDNAIVNALNDIATYPNIRVVNMSFGSYAISQTQQIAINNLFNANKLLIAAAGNDDSIAPMYPAAYSSVISVSAVGVSSSLNYVPASYSNYGTTIDVSAPGGESNTGYGIMSSLPNNSYGYMQGTSMAAPHVTGLASLIWAVNPFLSNSQVRTIIEQQVFDLGAPGWDPYFGSGMCNAAAACSTACSQLSITISANGNTSFCTGGSVPLNAPFNSNVTYQWRRNGVNISGANSNSYTATSSGNYSLYILTTGNCQVVSNVVTVTLNTLPSAPSSISGPSSVCTGQNNINYTIPAISNASSYIWTFPIGVNGSSNSNSIILNFTSSAISGNITIRGVNSCGNGPALSLPITVNQAPSAPLIGSSSGTILCSGNSLILTSNSSIGNQWFNNGVSIPGANGSNYSAISGGTYTLISTVNGCASGVSNPLVIAEVQYPPTPTISVNGNTNVCTGNTVILTSSANNGNQWYLNGNALSSANAITYTPAFSGNYTVIASNSGCASSPSQPIAVSIIQSPATPSIDWNGTQFSTSAAGVSYQWYLNGSPIPGATASTYTPTAIGAYQVRVTANGCTSSSNNYQLNVTSVDPTNMPPAYAAQLYPNPAKNDFVLRFGESPQRTLEIQLINCQGLVVRTMRTRNKFTTIDAKGLAAGLYFVKIIGDSYNQVSKIEIIK